ncbi:hypothetical protein GN956_G25467 [Arapaima gigas]
MQASGIRWMRARWTSDPCYAFYSVDGSDCSFLIYLSEVEWFWPPLAWRNHTKPQPPKAPGKRHHLEWLCAGKRAHLGLNSNANSMPP